MPEMPITIVLIEDNPGDARLIGEILVENASGRFVVRHADRLANGLDLLGESGADVILLDLSLPDSTGLDTFRRTCERAPQVPVVVLTARDDEAVAAEALNA